MKKILSLFLVIILSITIFSGCVDTNESLNDNDVDNSKKYTINMNYPRDHLGLNDAGESAFTAACNKYSELKSSMNEDEARNELVNQLNNDFEFVKEASLSDDGYTIAIIFEDDTAALMITYDFDSENYSVNTGSQFSKSDQNKKQNDGFLEPSNNILSVNFGLQMNSSNNCDVDFIVPQSKKVLIINALTLDMPYWSNYHERKINASFIENGWTKNDIDVKKRLSLNDGKLTPDDFFNYLGYGIIVYIGHGGYCPGYENSIPGHHYIECCDINVNFTSIVGEKRLDQYRTWRDQGRLIYGGYYTDDAEMEWEWELLIDTDLIMENAKIDPGTIVYMSSCNSYRAADAYLKNDVGCFFGWDYRTDIKISADAFEELINFMSEDDIPQNGADALYQISDRTSDYGGTLQIYDNELDVYLPCYGKLVAQPSSPPSGTSYYELEFSPYGSTDEVKINSGEEIEYDGVSPVNTSITIRAIGSTGNPLETSITFPILQCGENDLLTIDSWETYGIMLESDPSSVKDDGIETSIITATIRTWQDTDVLKPTGTPIACKEVEFITNLGDFMDSEKAFTDENGKATIEIASDEEGTATIKAIVEEDAVESYKNTQVTFGNLPYSFRLISWDSEDVYDSGFGDPRIIYEHDWRYWLAFDSIGDTEYYEIDLKINGQEYVFGGFREDQEYITDGKLQPYWDNIPASWNDDYNNGTRFLELGGATHSGEDDGTFNSGDISQKQTDLLTFLEGCTFEIETYTDY